MHLGSFGLGVITGVVVFSIGRFLIMKNSIFEKKCLCCPPIPEPPPSMLNSLLPLSPENKNALLIFHGEKTYLYNEVLKNYEIYSIDKNSEQKPSFCGDALNVLKELPSKTFDVCFLFQCECHTQEFINNDLEPSLVEINRILKDGGKLHVKNFEGMHKRFKITEKDFECFELEGTENLLLVSNYFRMNITTFVKKEK